MGRCIHNRPFASLLPCKKRTFARLNSTVKMRGLVVVAILLIAITLVSSFPFPTRHGRDLHTEPREKGCKEGWGPDARVFPEGETKECHGRCCTTYYCHDGHLAIGDGAGCLHHDEDGESTLQLEESTE